MIVVQDGTNAVVGKNIMAGWAQFFYVNSDVTTLVLVNNFRFVIIASLRVFLQESQMVLMMVLVGIFLVVP